MTHPSPPSMSDPRAVFWCCTQIDTPSPAAHLSNIFTSKYSNTELIYIPEIIHEINPAVDSFPIHIDRCYPSCVESRVGFQYILNVHNIQYITFKYNL